MNTGNPPLPSKNSFALAALLSGIVVLSSSTAVAQSSAPEDRDPAPLTITAPLPGSEVETPFVLQGTAGGGALLELWIGDDLEKVFRASSEGRFHVAVTREIPRDAPLSVFQVDSDGSRAATASVDVRWVGAKARQPPVATAGAGPDTETDSGVVATQVDWETPAHGGNRSRRLILQSLGGVGGAALGGLGLALVGIGVGAVVAPDSYAFLTLGVIGAFTGYALGIPTGVTAVGHLMDAKGKWVHSLLGALAGAAVGGLVGGGIHAALFAPELLVLGLLVPPYAGAIVGYELSNNRAARTDGPTMSFAPLMAPTLDAAQGRPVGASLHVRF